MQEALEGVGSIAREGLCDSGLGSTGSSFGVLGGSET